MFLRRFPLCAPEDDLGAGGGGGGDEGAGSQPADADPNPPDPAEGGGAPDSGDGSGDGSDPARGARRQEEPQHPVDRARSPRRTSEQHIPYSRVQQMVQRAQQREREALRAEIGPILAQINPENMRKGMVDQLLRALGQEPKKPEPKYLTQEDVNRLVSEQMGQFGQRFDAYARQQQLDRDTQQAEAELSSFKSKNAELFEDYPELEEDIANLWGSRWAVENKLSIAQIADWKVAKLKAAIGKYNERSSGAREELAEVRPIKPGQSGKAPAPKGKGDLTDAGTKKAAIKFLTGGGRK